MSGPEKGNDPRVLGRLGSLLVSDTSVELGVCRAIDGSMVLVLAEPGPAAAVSLDREDTLLGEAIPSCWAAGSIDGVTTVFVVGRFAEADPTDSLID